jgi:hypothetical protein
VWCVRNSNDRSKSFEHMNLQSGPCHICVTRLLKYGFQKMGYSDNSGNMVIVKLEEYRTHQCHLSASQLKCMPNITI